MCGWVYVRDCRRSTSIRGGGLAWRQLQSINQSINPSIASQGHGRHEPAPTPTHPIKTPTWSGPNQHRPSIGLLALMDGMITPLLPSPFLAIGTSQGGAGRSAAPDATTRMGGASRHPTDPPHCKNQFGGSTSGRRRLVLCKGPAGSVSLVQARRPAKGAAVGGVIRLCCCLPQVSHGSRTNPGPHLWAMVYECEQEHVRRTGGDQWGWYMDAHGAAGRASGRAQENWIRRAELAAG